MASEYYRGAITFTDLARGRDRTSSQTSTVDRSADPDDRRIVALCAATIGGLCLFASVFLPWSQSGAGSAISAREVGDLALAGTVEAWVPQWLGLVIYVVPAAGALLLIGAGLGGRSGFATGLVGLVAGTVVCGLAFARLLRADDGGLGSGAMLAGAGLAAGALSVVVEARSVVRNTTPNN